MTMVTSSVQKVERTVRILVHSECSAVPKVAFACEKGSGPVKAGCGPGRAGVAVLARLARRPCGACAQGCRVVRAGRTGRAPGWPAKAGFCGAP